MEKREMEHLSSLARLSLTDEEQARFREDFARILEYVAQVQSVAVDTQTDPEVREHHNVFREDASSHDGGVYTDALVSAAPHTKDGALEVKKILHND